MTEEWTPQNVSQVGKLRRGGGQCRRRGDLRTAHSRPGPTPAQSPALGLSEGTLAGGARTSGGSDPAGGPGGFSGGRGDNRRESGMRRNVRETLSGAGQCGVRQAVGGCLWGTAETGFWDPATGEANSSVWPFSARGPGHHSIPAGSSAGGRGSPPGTFKEMDRERCPCILVTHQTLCGSVWPLWVRGPVPPGPPVHGHCHCALALSSSLCTVLYSTWKCWTAV